MSCCSDCGQGCFGGYLDAALQYLQSHGVPLGGKYGTKESCQPDTVGPCSAQNGTILCPKVREHAGWCFEYQCWNEKYIRSSMLIKSRSSFSIPADEKTIKSEIYNNGPVLGVMTVYEDFFSYKNGVYRHTEGKRVGTQEVRVIGWGTDRKTGKAYWLVVNTWGKLWGENGRMKVVRGSNECDLEHNVFSFRVQ